jgi:DNA polymerase III epsilon subunit-like protein
MSIEFYITDVESLGLAVDIHEINQISVLRVSDQKQFTANIKVKHPERFSPQALEIQGITPSDLLVGIPIEETVEGYENFLKEDGKTKAHRCMIAHNAPFDRKFIHRAWENVNRDLSADLWLCTMSLAKRYVAKMGGDKLAQSQIKLGVEGIKKDKNGSLKPKFGLNNLLAGLELKSKNGAHQAEVDVQNTLVLFNWLMETKLEYVSLIERIPHKEIVVPQLDVSDF